MKKIIILILGVTVIMAGTLFLAFTESGNRMILPYINSQVNKQLQGTSVHANVTEFKLKPSSFFATVNINETADMQIEGPIDMWTQTFDLEYKIDAEKIATGEITINKPMHIAGKAKGESRRIHVTGDGDAFASKLTYDVKLVENTLENIKLVLNDASISELLAVAGQKPYAKGNLSVKVDMSEDDQKKLVGTYTLKSSGNAVTKVVKKEFDVDLGKTFTYQVVSTGKIKDEKLYSDVQANTTMGKLTLSDLNYDHTSAKMNAAYHLYISDLGKLQPLTKRRFRGDMDFTGEVSKDKALTITGNGEEFDGTVDYKLVNDQVYAHAKGATVSKIMYMLGYPQVLNALTEATVNYNLTTQSGDIDASMDNARLLPSSLTKLLKQLLQIDLEKINYPHATFTAKINKDISHFNFNASNTDSHVKLSQGTYNKRTQAVNAKVDILVEGMDIKGEIGGTVDHPKVSLDTSAYLKSKIEKKVDKLFDKKKTEGKVKGLIKGLF